MTYVDRADAGRRLVGAVAEVIPADAIEPPLVLGVPRGGVVVAREVAAGVAGELGVALARKIGAPHNPELAIGAIAEYGHPVLDQGLIDRLGVGDSYIDQTLERERFELRRRADTYRAGRLPPKVGGRVVVIVDDGVATGATLQAVLEAVRLEQPALLVCAVPVGAPDSVERLMRFCDVMICLRRPRWFRAVGEWYETFGQTSDEEVVAALSTNLR